jgi:hypothetical protein
MGFIDSLTKPIDWLSQIAPPAVKFLLFMLFIVFFGGLITNLILSNKYGCDAKGMLVDEAVYRGCGDQYMAGLVWKMNITKETCSASIGISDPYLNETICGDFLDNVKTVSWWQRIKLGFSSLVVSTRNWIKGIPTADEGVTSIAGYLAHPEEALCSGLYDCLPPEQRDALHVEPNCTIARGQSHAVDNYPTVEQFLQVSLLNRTRIQEDIDEFKIFGVMCTDLGRRQGYSPEIMFMGIPLFSFQIWVLIMIFGAMIWIIKKI